MHLISSMVDWITSGRFLNWVTLINSGKPLRHWLDEAFESGVKSLLNCGENFEVNGNSGFENSWLEILDFENSMMVFEGWSLSCTTIWWHLGEVLRVQNSRSYSTACAFPHWHELSKEGNSFCKLIPKSPARATHLGSVEQFECIIH